MSTLTIRIPEAKHARLRLLAQNRGVSMNKLMDELATVALTQLDAETRFRALAAKGSVKRGLELLDNLDRRFRGTGRGGQPVKILHGEAQALIQPHARLPRK